MDKKDNGIALQPSQEAAIAHFRAQALALRPAAEELIQDDLRMSNLPPSTMDAVLSVIRQHARVALHFHPDRPVPVPTSASGEPAPLAMRTVAAALLADGVYKSQFETGISNGGVSAFAGGARDRWERDLFAGAYHGAPAEDGPPHLAYRHRPKYGALDLLRTMDGPAPRFGSSYFVLRPEVSARTTFTYGGSQSLPREVGTLDEFAAVLAAVLEEAFTRESALGWKGVRPKQVVERLLALAAGDGTTWMGLEPSKNLDVYVEAQIHGDILLSRDVEALVADPSFKNTSIGSELVELAKKYGFELKYHHGLQLAAEHVPDDFRGDGMPSLAKRIAREGLIDVEVIGSAVRDLASHPEKWVSRGSYAFVLQELKLLWHVLVRFGKPFPTT